MNDPLKPRIDFTQPFQDAPAQTLRTGVNFEGETARDFQPIEQEAPAETEEGVETAIQNVFKPKRSLWRIIARCGVMLFGVSIIAQVVQWVHIAWRSQDWISLGGSVAAMMVVVAGVGAILAEWRRIYRLRQRSEERDIASELLQSHGIDKGREFCEKLALQAGLSHGHPAWQHWQAAAHETHNDREMVILYSKLVQPVLDEQVRREINRSAAESALIIAVSPLAIVDMAFIAWRNIRLINRIAALYGIELGYFSRIRLFRLVLLNIAFAGVSEVVREIGMDWMSQDLAAKLSARAAQGLGAGLLTARLGIKAMELCRPLPWLDDKPKLADFRRQLITQLKQTLKKSDNSQ